jgi:predicted deacylase
VNFGQFNDLENLRTAMREKSSTLLKEAERHVGSKYVDQVLDFHVLETAMQHFFLRAEMGKNAGRNHSEVDADFEKAAHLAAMVAPYRHARLSTVKLAGDPSNPVHFKDDATADELRAEIERRLNVLREAGILELRAIEAPETR